MLDRSIDREKILGEATQFFDELFQLDQLLREISSEQKAAILKYQEGSGINLPSIMSVNARAKTFILKAEHSTQNLFRICQVYADLKPGKTGWFDGFVATAAREELSLNENEQLKAIAKFAQFIHNCRHCVEHEKDGQRLDVRDFQLNPDGSVRPPTIEIIHIHTPEPKINLVQFMYDLIESLLRIFEEISAFIAFFLRSKEWKDHVGVADFPPEKRLHPFVKFYYVMNLNGEPHPIG